MAGMSGIEVWAGGLDFARFLVKPKICWPESWPRKTKLFDLLEKAENIHTGIGGKSILLVLDNTKIFVKKSHLQILKDNLKIYCPQLIFSNYHFHTILV